MYGIKKEGEYQIGKIFLKDLLNLFIYIYIYLCELNWKPTNNGREKKELKKKKNS